jgi:hypothetical protein
MLVIVPRDSFHREKSSAFFFSLKHKVNTAVMNHAMTINQHVHASPGRTEALS